MTIGLRQICDISPELFTTKPGDFCTPGCWVSLLAHARQHRIPLEKLGVDSHLGYLRAMDIEAALGLADTYPHQRVNRGESYSPFVVLDTQEMTDAATSTMHGCVRSIFSSQGLEDFCNSLCSVIGDAHSNVWAHAKSPGISLAQKWAIPNQGSQGHYLEFALADCGIGFLPELKRAGIARTEGIASDADAIGWCIKKGNSSKGNKPVDEWAQRLPDDFVDNPMPGIGQTINDNHHLGLGLDKLVGLVLQFSGELWLASGGSLLHIRADGTRRYVKLRNAWQGVALACRFRTDKVLAAPAATPDSRVEQVAAALRRSVKP